MGIGDVQLETNTRCTLVLKKVRHVPDIRLNLITIRKLDDEGHFNYFGDGKRKLFKGSLIVARDKRHGSLYVMHAKLCKGEVNVVVSEFSIELWHKQLGHISEKGMQILAKNRIFPELKDVQLRTCVDYLAGKQHRVAFKRAPPSRKGHVLDLVHTNVCSMSERSLGGGAKYFVSFIDDHSRKVWGSTLKSKDQMLESFKDFHAKVERETGMKLKFVRADNGGEYRGPFEAYCKTHGIRLAKPVPKTLNSPTKWTC